MISHLKTKASDFGFFKITADNFCETNFEEMLKARSLFDKKYVVVSEYLFEVKDIRDFIVNKLERGVGSENIFIFLDIAIGEECLAEFKKRSVKSQRFDLLEGVKLRNWFSERKISDNVAEKIITMCGSDLWRASQEIEKYRLGSESGRPTEMLVYNPFAICDAFAEKNKIKTWTMFQQALVSGITTEEVFFKILWQIKTLLMVKKMMVAGVSDIAKASGLHAFVVSKAVKAMGKFTEEELINCSYRMLEIYHRERRGELELPIEFERFILSY